MLPVNYFHLNKNANSKGVYFTPAAASELNSLGRIGHPVVIKPKTNPDGVWRC